MFDCTLRATPRRNNWHRQINLAQRSLCNHPSPLLYFCQPQSHHEAREQESPSPPYLSFWFGCSGLWIHSRGKCKTHLQTCPCRRFSLWVTNYLEYREKQMALGGFCFRCNLEVRGCSLWNMDALILSYFYQWIGAGSRGSQHDEGLRGGMGESWGERRGGTIHMSCFYSNCWPGARVSDNYVLTTFKWASCLMASDVQWSCVRQ